MAYKTLKPEYIANILHRGKDNGLFNDQDIDLINQFNAERMAGMNGRKGITLGHALSDTTYLRNFKKFNPLPFSDWTSQDLMGVIGAMNQSQDFKQNGKVHHIQTLKTFFQFLKRKGKTKIKKDIIDGIHPGVRDNLTVTAEMLLTEEDIRSMIEACKQSRDRALISTLYEGGFRAVEIGKLTWRQVNIGEVSATINTAEKTGKPRFVTLVMAREFLSAWKRDYRGVIGKDPEGDAYVFLTRQKNARPFTYSGLSWAIREIAKRAGIKKRITVHLFRHSRITHLIRKGFQETVIKKMMWGNTSTPMISVYSHLVSADVEDECLSKSGLKVKKKSDTDTLKPRQCPRCFLVTAFDARFCPRCGMGLTDEAVAEQKNVSQMLANLPTEFLAALFKLAETEEFKSWLAERERRK